VVAITKSLRYTVANPIAITKSLQYAVKLSPSGTVTKRLDYRIKRDDMTELYHRKNTTYIYYYRTVEYTFISKSLTYVI
jgi:hypothetical protein